MTAQSRLPLLVLTRPAAQAKRFVHALPSELQEAVQVIYAPLLSIKQRDVGDLTGVQGLVLTSQNAVQALHGQQVAGLRAFCVGGQTTRAALAVGLDAISFDGNADDLVDGVSAHAPTGPLVHLRGGHTRGDVAGRLTAMGFPTSERVVYDQIAQSLHKTLKQDLALGVRAIAPLFSPRTARLFAAECQEALQTDVICLSHAVASDLATGRYRAVHTCAKPTGEAMAQAIYRAVLAKPLEGLPLSG